MNLNFGTPLSRGEMKNVMGGYVSPGGSCSAKAYCGTNGSVSCTGYGSNGCSATDDHGVACTDQGGTMRWYSCPGGGA